MGKSFRIFSTTAIAFAFLAAPSVANDFDGKWSGKWGGGSSATINIKNDKVTSYYFKGHPQPIGGSKRAGDKMTFGSDYKIIMTLTGKNTAHAAYSRKNDKAEANMTR